MKQEQGVVVSVDGALAHVKVGRHADCTACGGCASIRNVFIDAANPVGAQPGQRVRFAMQEEHMLLGAFVVFIAPLLAAAVGAFAGWRMAGGMEPSGAAAGGAAVCFLAALWGVRRYDRRVGRSLRMRPVITEVLPPA